MSITRFSFPTTIPSGAGVRARCGPHPREGGLERPSIVTDKGLASSPLMAEPKAALESAGLDVARYPAVEGRS